MRSLKFGWKKKIEKFLLDESGSASKKGLFAAGLLGAALSATSVSADTVTGPNGYSFDKGDAGYSDVRLYFAEHCWARVGDALSFKVFGATRASCHYGTCCAKAWVRPPVFVPKIALQKLGFIGPPDESYVKIAETVGGDDYIEKEDAAEVSENINLYGQDITGAYEDIWVVDYKLDGGMRRDAGCEACVDSSREGKPAAFADHLSAPDSEDVERHFSASNDVKIEDTIQYHKNELSMGASESTLEASHFHDIQTDEINGIDIHASNHFSHGSSSRTQTDHIFDDSADEWWCADPDSYWADRNPD